jgi:hypothetical protein
MMTTALLAFSEAHRNPGSSAFMAMADALWVCAESVSCKSAFGLGK